MINFKLIELYEKYLPNLEAIFEDTEDIDGPLLMSCFEEDYLASKYKILFVGKEPNGWIGYYSSDMPTLLKRYEDFGLCTQNGSAYTNFWQYVYNFNLEINPNSQGKKNFLWTNTSKCSFNGKALVWDDHKKFVELFNVLEKEIEITNPDIVVFFTGPSYDDKIKIQFSGEVLFEQVEYDIPINELAKVIHSSLPFHSYRVYHPDYMAIYNPEKASLMETIKKQIEKV